MDIVKKMRDFEELEYMDSDYYNEELLSYVIWSFLNHSNQMIWWPHISYVIWKAMDRGGPITKPDDGGWPRESKQ